MGSFDPHRQASAQAAFSQRSGLNHWDDQLSLKRVGAWKIKMRRPSRSENDCTGRSELILAIMRSIFFRITARQDRSVSEMIPNLEFMKEPESGSTNTCSCLLDRTDHLRDEQLLRESFPQFGHRRRNSCSASRSMQYVCHDSVYITMRGNVCSRPRLADDVPHVTLRWTNVKECSVGRQHVIDFAGVDDTDKGVAHDYRVQIPGPERGG